MTVFGAGSRYPGQADEKFTIEEKENVHATSNDWTWSDGGVPDWRGQAPDLSSDDSNGQRGDLRRGCHGSNEVGRCVRRNHAAPGFAISDASQGGVSECKWEIQTADGLLGGRFMDSGLFPHQITGASGVFLGIRGTQSVTQAVIAPRRASMTEDPSLRRALGGGSIIHTFHFAPSYPPAIEGPADSPQVYRGDLSAVTVASPAHAGETLISRASNLGFTTPAVDPGAAFPGFPYGAVNSPVEAIIGGRAVDAFNALGWPGEVDVYRVDFRVPDGTAPGMVDVQLRVGGIAGPTVKIPVR